MPTPLKQCSPKVIVSSEDKRLNGQLFHPTLNPNNVNTLIFVKQEKDDRQLWFMDVANNKMRQINPVKKEESVEDYEEDAELLFQAYTDQVALVPRIT